jgi:hypothetical protein
MKEADRKRLKAKQAVTRSNLAELILKIIGRPLNPTTVAQKGKKEKR